MLQKKGFKFQLKEISDNGEFIGLASVYGVKDLQGDVVVRGAFTRTLQHKNGEVVILYQHNPAEPIGLGQLEDSDNGLIIKGKLNLEVQRAKEAYALLKQGALKGLSIGYDTIKEAWEGTTRLLKEVRLWEVSLVTFPANPLAQVTGVKSVVPFQDLPIADEGTSWDGNAARKRLLEYAGGKDDFDSSKYMKGFLWYDSNNADSLGAYKLPIADIIDGKLMAVPKAIYAAAAAISGARGGVDIPEEDMPKVKSHLEKYYKKLEKDPPWKKCFKASDFENTLSGALTMRELTRLLWDLQDALQMAIVNTVSDDTLTNDQKIALVETSLDQFKDAIITWVRKLSEVSGSKSFDVKEGRVLSAKNRQLVEEAIDLLGKTSTALTALLEASEPKDSGKTNSEGKDVEGLSHLKAIAEEMKQLSRR